LKGPKHPKFDAMSDNFRLWSGTNWDMAKWRTALSISDN